MPEQQVKHRLEAMAENIEWLQENDLKENTLQAYKRIGLIKGDLHAVRRYVGGHDE